MTVLFLFCSASLAEETPDAASLLNQARTYFSNQNLSDASRIYRMLIETYPDSPLAADAWQELSNVYEVQNRYVEAAAALSTLYDKWPDGPLAPQALYNKARILYNSGRTLEALDIYRLCARKFPDNSFATSANIQLGSILFTQAKYSDAAAAFKKAASSKDRNVSLQAKRSLAESYMLAGNYYDAEATLLSLQKEQPENDYYKEMLAKTYSAQNEPEKSIPIYEYLLNKYPDNLMYQDNFFNVLKKTGGLDKKIMELEKKADAKPFDLPSVKQLAKIYIWKKDSISALNQYEKIVEAEPKNNSAALMLARLYFENQWRKKAISTLESLLQSTPGDPQVLQLLGDILQAEGRTEEARRAWEQSVAFSESDVNSYMRLGSFFIGKGMTAEATSLYENGRKTFSDNNLFSSDLVYLYKAQMRYRDAVNEFLRILASGQPAPGRFSDMISMLKSEQLKSDSLKIVRDWLDRAPGSRQLLLFYTQTCYALGSPEDALLKLSSYADSHPGEADVFFESAQMFLDGGDFPSSAALFSKASERPLPRSLQSNAVMNAARTYSWAGDISSAAASYRKLIDQFPESPDIPDALYQLASILRANGDCYSASSLLNRLIEAYPNAAFTDKARVDLARCSISGGDFKRADELLTETIANSTSAADMDEVFFLQGETKFIRGMLSEAQPIYKKIAESFPESRFVNDALERMLFILDASGVDTILVQSYMTAVRDKSAGKFKEAADLFQGMALTMNETALGPHAAYEYALCLSSLNDDSSAEKAFLELADKEKEGELFSMALLHAAEIQSRQKRSKEALRTYQRLIDTDPTSYWAHEARDKLQVISDASEKTEK